ncbi:DsbC family protein [bacterium]|nr:DsbC family protein [bacterium]
MRTRSKLFLCLAFLASGAAMIAMTAYGGPEQVPDVLDALKKAYPNISADQVRESEIEGLYEVVSGGAVLYFAPKGNYMVFGEIWTPEGKSVTATRREELVSRQLQALPLDQAIRIGKGPNIVIEFTDPDCPFCRKAAEFFRERQDVTRFVFFSPLVQLHPDAEKKAAWILAAKDRGKAYHEVMSGRKDKETFPAPSAEASGLVARHRQLAVRMGVMGTPMFWINGKAVQGANIPLLEGLLREGGDKKEKR